MQTYPDLQMRELQEKAHRARTLQDEGRHAEAKEAFIAASALGTRLGVDSAYLAISVAICTDQCGDLEEAFGIASEAIALDPLNPSAIQTFNGMAWRLRGLLGTPDRPTDNPSTPRLYALLLEAGEADVACHLAMARHHTRTGRLAEAAALLDAVVRLAPVSRDAWLARAELARASSQEMLAAECEAQAKGLATTRIPFGLARGRGLPC